MKKVGTIKISIYIILLIGAIAFLVYTKIQASYPFGEKELQNHQLLAIVPNDCKTCDQILYYRNPENNNCSIKKVISHLENNQEILTISIMSLEKRIQEKGNTVYIMPRNINQLFKKQCYKFTK